MEKSLWIVRGMRVQLQKQADRGRAAGRSVSSGRNRLPSAGGIVSFSPDCCPVDRYREIIDQSPLLRHGNPVQEKAMAFSPSAGPVQFITYKGYLSGDSWVDWLNGWKPGAGEKWDHLKSLYDQAREGIKKECPNRAAAKKKLDTLDKKAIGFSQYDDVAAELYTINREIDPAYAEDEQGIEQNREYHQGLMEALQDDIGKTCRVTQSAQVSFEGETEPVKLIKALLFKIYASEKGKVLCDTILNKIESFPKKTFTFKPGTESEAENESSGFVLHLNLNDRGYASGDGGKIIVNSLEIVTVHELGHVVGYLNLPDRGTPSTSYTSLGGEEQELWSTAEEYLNINQVENPYRKSLGVPKRKYHGGDSVILGFTNLLTRIFRHDVEIDTLLAVKAEREGEGVLLSHTEKHEVSRCVELIKKEDSRSDEESLELRWLVRRNQERFRTIASMDISQFRKKKGKGENILKKHGDWKNRLPSALPRFN